MSIFLKPVPAAERIPQSRFLHKKRLGMLTNDAAQVNTGETSRGFLKRKGLNLLRLFSPEHGIATNQPDGAAVNDQKDGVTGLPVISLYGDKQKPEPENLQSLDAILFDVPDVGCRFYTYLWSMTYMMDACEEAGIPLIILDRPNPIGGNILNAEGPMLDEAGCSSFIGRWRIPITHYVTLGELALYFKDYRTPGLSLQVVPCEGWDRNFSFFEKQLPFIPTSPAIRDAETALLYPGMGLLEGIEVNEGRGTPYPFRQFGAPWIVSEVLKECIISYCNKNGVSLLTTVFVPEWGLYAGQVCHGLRFSISDVNQFKPVGFGLHLIKCLFLCFPQHIKPRLYHTVANPNGEHHLDRLLGVKDAFEKIKNGQIQETGVSDVWKKAISPFLLY